GGGYETARGRGRASRKRLRRPGNPEFGSKGRCVVSAIPYDVVIRVGREAAADVNWLPSSMFPHRGLGGVWLVSRSGLGIVGFEMEMTKMKSIRCMSRGAALIRGAGLLALALGAASPAVAQCTGFNLSQSSGASIVPGTTDLGVHSDDATINVTLPFPITLYGAAYTTANVSTNGNIQFTTNSSIYTNACLPQGGSIGVAICPHWDDLMTTGTGE